MKEEREKWIAKVLNSLDGSKRAEPRDGLFDQINQQLFSPPEARVLGLPQWRMAAVAAVLLLLLNIFALQQFTQASRYQSDEYGAASPAEQMLISNYKLYD